MGETPVSFGQLSDSGLFVQAALSGHSVPVIRSTEVSKAAWTGFEVHCLELDQPEASASQSLALFKNFVFQESQAKPVLQNHW